MTNSTESNGSTTGTTHIKALCCTCGALRTWSRKAGLRNHLWRAWTAEEIADCEQRYGRQWVNPEPYHRQLADMKCGTCKKVTRHALLSAKPQARDNDEIEDRQQATSELGKSEFEEEKARLERFGIEFEFRDDTPFMVGGGIHFYDIEQYDDEIGFLLRLNPNLPWPLLSYALEDAWRTISDAWRCERAAWTRREDHRSLYYTVSDRTLDDYLARELVTADKWARVWTLRERPQ
jgi:hypothetical protein